MYKGCQLSRCTPPTVRDTCIGNQNNSKLEPPLNVWNPAVHRYYMVGLLNRFVLQLSNTVFCYYHYLWTIWTTPLRQKSTVVHVHSF